MVRKVRGSNSLSSVSATLLVDVILTAPIGYGKSNSEAFNSGKTPRLSHPLDGPLRTSGKPATPQLGGRVEARMVIWTVIKTSERVGEIVMPDNEINSESPLFTMGAFR